MISISKQNIQAVAYNIAKVTSTEDTISDNLTALWVSLSRFRFESSEQIKQSIADGKITADTYVVALSKAQGTIVGTAGRVLELGILNSNNDELEN